MFKKGDKVFLVEPAYTKPVLKNDKLYWEDIPEKKIECTINFSHVSPDDGREYVEIKRIDNGQVVIIDAEHRRLTARKE